MTCVSVPSLPNCAPHVCKSDSDRAPPEAGEACMTMPPKARSEIPPTILPYLHAGYQRPLSGGHSGTVSGVRATFPCATRMPLHEGTLLDQGRIHEPHR